MTSTDIRLKQELAQENKRLSEELEIERAARSHLVRRFEAKKDEYIAQILKLEEDNDKLNREIFWLTRD
jgi:hypothetical protein